MSWVNSMVANTAIVTALKSGLSIILIGTPDSGKTWYIQNNLMPFLIDMGIPCTYYENPGAITNAEYLTPPTVAIIDEVESLLDKPQLESKYPTERPNYTNTYISRVEREHQSLGKITTQCVYVISRKDRTDVDQLCTLMSNAEWTMREVTPISFNKYL